MSIENTQSPGSIHATALLALATGDTSAVIEGQERAGQAQLVHSDQLPTDMSADDQAAFEALGFRFGETDGGDRLFRPATLPDGWKKEGADHAMWSYIVDDLGRRRVAIFYKAAFYDRRAFMRLNTVAAYVADCMRADADVVTDATWATPAAVAAAAERWAERAAETVAEWEQRIDGPRARYDDPGARKDAERWAAEARAERDAYLAIAAKHTAN